MSCWIDGNVVEFLQRFLSYLMWLWIRVKAVSCRFEFCIRIHGMGRTQTEKRIYFYRTRLFKKTHQLNNTFSLFCIENITIFHPFVSTPPSQSSADSIIFAYSFQKMMPKRRIKNEYWIYTSSGSHGNDYVICVLCIMIPISQLATEAFKPKE